MPCNQCMPCELRTFGGSWLLLVVFATWTGAAEPEQPEAATADKTFVKWRASLVEGFAAAQSGRAPIVVRVGADWCAFCREQEPILAQNVVQSELRRWIPVSLDVDASPDDAESLAVASIPAFRLLTPSGQLIASHDGLMQAAELVQWLQLHYDEAAVIIGEELLAEGPPDAEAVGRLLQDFQHRDPIVRQAAIRQLSPYPGAAAHRVIEMFPGASLASRLTALDLLGEWKAPIGGIDPWLPESVTEERLAALTVWARDIDPAAARTAEEQRPLAGDELADVDSTMRRMIGADPAEAAALREQLARYGRRLLPTVYAALAKEESDVARVQLTALRYRLVAAPDLVLRWPGGLERLADLVLPTRVAAADELAERAKAADEPLLLELFSDPAPLVREISLRALQHVGGSNASSALIRLLEDPDPNVRAAVLKQLGEHPAPGLVGSISKYIAKEADHDLVVHAVRLLREAPGNAGLETLKSLLDHPSWRVRAEAAEAVGKAAAEQTDDASKANNYVALIDLLDDEDSFVVSRAVESLVGADLVTAVEPLVAAAEKHPDIAPNVVAALSQGAKQRTKALPHIRKFCQHPLAAVRAAAVTGLCAQAPEDAVEEFRAATLDADALVRIAAADTLFKLITTSLDARLTRSTPNYFGFSGRFGRKFWSSVSARSLGLPAVLPADTTSQQEAVRDDPVQADETAEADSDGPPAPPQSDSARQRRKAALDASAPEEPEPEAEQALQVFRRGERRPTWLSDYAEAVTPLLSASGVDERLAAARPLAILTGSPALEILQNSAQDPALHGRVAEGLPYLLWPERVDLFRRIIETTWSDDMLTTAARSLVHLADHRAAAELWRLLSRDKLGAAAVDGLLYPLRTAYFGSSYVNADQITDSQRELALKETATVLANGGRWQRTAALVLRYDFDEEAASESARALLADTAIDPQLRADAYALLLRTDRSDTSMQNAVEGLSSTDAGLVQLALGVLTYGPDSVTKLPSGLELANGTYSRSHDQQQEKAGLPEPPHGLTVAAVRPLLSADNAEIAAQAGYLLVLLGEPEGFAPLRKYWESAGRENTALTQMFYRAVALQDDAAFLPTLEEIYTHMHTHGDGDLRDFYWSIRGMTDRRAAALRKKMRDEVGMDSLR